MSLPTIDAYAFPVTIPSTGKSIKMRPFLVREEKLLLMAQESDEYQQQAESVAQVIRNCTENVVDPTTLPFFDAEYLLLQLRARSVGEIATPIYICHHQETPESPECGHRTKVEINLSTVAVDKSAREAAPTAHIITVSDRYTLFMKDPNIFVINDLIRVSAESNGVTTTKMIDTLVELFDVLKDSDTGTVYQFSEYTSAEKIAFMESLTPAVYGKILEFMDTIPTLSQKVSYTCEKCQTTYNFTLKGLTDFLV